MEIEKAYMAKKYEDDIYRKWEESGFFSPTRRRRAFFSKRQQPFVISMPPPNATGTLHLGHAVMLALEDIMIRYHRMKGDASLWVPGTDHASIATQNKVEQELAKEDKTRHDLGREKFLERVHAFVRKSQHTIRTQIRKMGSSCDWSRERYTLDPGLSRAVQEVFILMYNDGLIYRGDRIVNWCPRCASTLADDEVEYKEEKAKFYYFRYGPFTIGTARPETKFQDKIIVVHPEDKRYEKYIGTEMTVPWIEGDVKAKILADKSVDPTFGTGAMTITPAHDFNDFQIAKRHGLEIVLIIDEKGNLTSAAGSFAGKNAHGSREAIVKKLQEKGLVEKIDENYIHNVSVCYRCGTPIEPLISKQWFVDVDKKIKLRAGIHGRKLKIASKQREASLKEIALSVVRNGEIKILPEQFEKTYFHWMENLHDWCISRQIWFGHRIPVWYCVGDEKEGSACKIECTKPLVQREKPDRCAYCGSSNFRQDPDTLDTWFSSGLWTFSTLGWPEKTEDLMFYHPTAVLETGYDILFFWIARMILMTTYALGEIPFHTVYLHGLIRTRTGDKMSKSKPETCIDPLDMIEKYGADALRLSMVIGSGPGNDVRLYEEKIAGFRNFINKIWNAARFALLNITEENFKKSRAIPQARSIADRWIITRTQRLVAEVTEDLEKYRLGEAGTKIYDFTWGEFCDWYLEISKGEHKNSEILLYVLKTILKLLHPFVPYVTEAIWANLGEKEMLIAAQFPKVEKKLMFSKETKQMQLIIDAISAIRKMRHENNVEAAKKVHAIVFGGSAMVKLLEMKREPITRLARLERLDLVSERTAMPMEKVPESISEFLPSGLEIYLPIRDLIDINTERKNLEKEMSELERYLKSLEAKLNNAEFRKKAPSELVRQQEDKLKEGKNRLRKIEKKMKMMRSS